MNYIPGASQQLLEFLTPNPKKIDFGGWCGKKNTRVVFAVPDTSDVLEWKKAFKKRSNSVKKNRSKPFVSVLELKKAFWSGNNRSGVLFLLNLAKLIDFGFGVEISTIKRIQVLIIIILMILI